MTTITTAVPAVRTFILAFLILAGSLGAAFAMPAREAAASGPCDVWAMGPKYAMASNGRYYFYGRGATGCDYSNYQAMIVRLYTINSAGTYTLVARNDYGAYTNSLVGNTDGVWAACGIRYRTHVAHVFKGYSTTAHWSVISKLC